MEPEEIQLLIISFSIVVLTLILTLFILFFFFQKKKSRFLMEKMEADILFHSELTKSKIEIKEQTLTNISRELHDNVGQILSVALMQMNILIDNKEGYNKKDLQGLKELVNKSLNEIRILSKLINGDITLKSSFIETVSDDLDRITQLKKIKCKLNIEGKVLQLDKGHETIIYRILQEAISNILRHSQSESIIINVLFSNNNCKIDVIDYGNGFNIEKCTKGSGLSNMKIRAELIGATFSVFSDHNTGSILMIDYPIKTETIN